MNSTQTKKLENIAVGTTMRLSIHVAKAKCKLIDATRPPKRAAESFPNLNQGELDRYFLWAGISKLFVSYKAYSIAKVKRASRVKCVHFIFSKGMPKTIRQARAIHNTKLKIIPTARLISIVVTRTLDKKVDPAKSRAKFFR